MTVYVKVIFGSKGKFILLFVQDKIGGITEQNYYYVGLMSSHNLVCLGLFWVNSDRSWSETTAS